MSSDSHATITYTLMSSYEVVVNGYFGMPMDPLDPYAQLVMEAPPSPDYITRPEAPPSPDYIPGPEYPEYLSPADDVFPAEEQPFLAAVSPTAESLGYIMDSEPEMDREEEDGDDEKFEGDSIDYSTNRGDDDTDDDGDDEPSDDNDDGDDTDDEDEEPFEDKEDDEEEEEHLASADSSAIPIVDLVLPAGDTEALEADEPTLTPRSPYTIIPLFQTRLRRAQKTLRLEPSIPTDTGAPLGYKAAEIRMRALLPSTSRRTDIPEVDVPPRKRACLTTPFLDSRSGRVPHLVLQGSQGLQSLTLGDTADRPDHRHIAIILDREAMYTREAWAGFEDRSAAIAAHVRTLEAQVATLIVQTSSL
nr:hypothetical protein [Tanacetum cinerariifolium]